MTNASSVFWLTAILLLIAAGMTYFFARTTYAIDKEQGHEKIEIRRMFFAAAILTGLGTLFVEGMILYYYSPSGSTAGKEIFDACKTILPPIITLVIGYFFGKGEAI